MIAAVRSLLTEEDNAGAGEGGGSGEGEAAAVGADTIAEDDLPTIYGELIGLDAEVVTCGASSIYHYPDEDGRPACRHDAATTRTATRRVLEPHHRPCRDCFDTPAAAGE